MTAQERRRDTRYRYPLDVELKIGGRWVAHRTENVGHHGMFIRTDSPPKMRQLLTLRATLPGGVEIETHAMTVWTVDAEDATADEPPGAGLQFYATPKNVHVTWSNFVNSVKTSNLVTDGGDAATIHPDHSRSMQPLGTSRLVDALDLRHAANRPATAPGADAKLPALRSLPSTPPAAQKPAAVPPPLPPPPPPKVPEPIRRSHRRVTKRIAVKPRTRQDLQTMYTRDISKGGMFLLTKREFAVGDSLQLAIVHPDKGTDFEFEAVIKHRRENGIGIQFVGLGIKERMLFNEFIHSEIEELDPGEIEFVDENDDKLL